MMVCVAQEYGAEHHRQSTKPGDAGRDVGFLVDGKAHLNKMQDAVPVQREFNQAQEGVFDGAMSGSEVSLE